ncbi:hypothetical protein EAE96_004651 [Botrytis aclada]|nr:hypothetical protein EAE96_004651 [Botrytis aclada]
MMLVMPIFELGAYKRVPSSAHIEGTTHDTQQSGIISSLGEEDKRAKVNHTGWRAGVRYCSGTALGVFAVNLTLLIWAVLKNGVDGGYSILYRGNCQHAQSLSTALHILINVLSTILLSASNYTMQCLNSPTRKAIDCAHAEKKWLDIGIPSWRNQRSISRIDKILWCLLGLSSIPLHFFYNSAVFLDLAAQQYSASITNRTGVLTLMNNDSRVNYTKLDYKECERIYNHEYVVGNGDLYLITPDIFYMVEFEQDGSVSYNHTLDSTYWENRTSFGLATFSLGNGTSWKSMYVSTSVSIDDSTVMAHGPFFGPIQTCYSETRLQHCKVKFSVLLVAIVIVCNIIKAVCMSLAIRRIKELPLVTLGDAIASFLRHPDSTTKGLCLVSKEDIQDHIWTKPLRPRQWKATREKAFWGASLKRWAIVNLLFGITGFLVITLPLFGESTRLDAGIRFGTSWKQTTAIIANVNMSGAQGLLASILLANLPQTITSFMNVLYNGLFTCMFLADEWDRYGHRKYPLRVTKPSVIERGDIARTTSSIGYSSLAILLSGIICIVMTAFINIKAIRRYRAGIPLVGSCSAAISAACHVRPEEGDISLVPVQWGVVRGAGESVGSWKNKDKDFGHCAFSGSAVAPPIPGRWYAGGREELN